MEGLYIEYIPLTELKRWDRNPKLHDKAGIRDSIDEFGYTDPMVIDERTGKLVAGHGRLDDLQYRMDTGEGPPKNVNIGDNGEWLIPVLRGNYFKDDAEAERYLMTVNKLVERGGWNEKLLATMVAERNPTGFDTIDRAKEVISQADVPEIPDTKATPPTEIQAGKLVKPAREKDEPESLEFDDIPGYLQGAWDIDENIIFPTDNPYGIPELREDRLLAKLPSPLKTWGGHLDTPDDGESWWLYNYGSVTAKKLPYSRSVLSFYTKDKCIETWWNAPSYRAGQVLKAGIKIAIVPDFSMWIDLDQKGVRVKFPTVLQMQAIYRAQWMGRFFQEVGIDVIPRIEYFAPCTCDHLASVPTQIHKFPCVRSFSLIGVPIGSPVVATQFHTGIHEEFYKMSQEALQEAMEIIKPKQLLVYSSEIGEQLVSECDLGDVEVVICSTAKRVRKNQDDYKETDPYLIELRKHKKGRERTKATGGG